MPRPPPRPTESWIRAIAARYLDRYAATEASLRRWLQRRVGEAVRAHSADPEEARRHVDAFVARMLELGVLNDTRFAESRAKTLRRRGASARAVRQALAIKGVSRDVVDGVLAEEHGDRELEAARTFARRHHLGPWRTGPVDPAGRAKELARLGRKGFSFETARRIVDASD
jgi:regulatory protein